MASPTPCETDSRPEPDPEANAVAPSTYPDSPASLTNDSVTAYVRSFERAFIRNEVLVDGYNVTYLEASVSGVEVANVTESDAFVVRLESDTNGGYLQSGGSGTPYQVHWDGAPGRVSYYVSENAVRRTAGSVGGEWPSFKMVNHGRTVACPGS